MRQLLALAILTASLLTECASPLATSVRVANALGAVASASGAAVNSDFAKADKSCLWTSDGSPSPLPLATQKACLVATRASYGPALRAYDAFILVWRPFAFAVRVAEANEILGRAPSVDSFAALLPDLLRTADAFAVQYKALVAPPLPSKEVH